MALINSETSSTAIEQNECTNVLAQFLQLFNNDCSQLKLFMAPNAVVDWFGRSVRGSTKIQDYLRNEVGSQYEHISFEKAAQCGPIECKPTHMKTKLKPASDVHYIHPINRVIGTTTLKTRADSDNEDDDDLDMMPLPEGETTPEKHLISELTPPASVVKHKIAKSNLTEEDNTDTDDEGDNTVLAMKAKRQKRTHTTPFSYLRRLPTSAATSSTTSTKRQYIDGIRTLRDDTSSDEETQAEHATDDADNKYTPLRYLQTTGVLRIQKQQLDAQESVSGSWDRAVRIRISYRMRIADQQPQFVLVIYEHLDRVVAAKNQTRRNLMSEFSQGTSNATNQMNTAEMQPAEHISEQTDELLTTIAITNTDEITSALETAALTLRTPTRVTHTPPATPKRKPRLPRTMSGLKRLNITTTTSATSTPKRSAARSLRL